jgi:hypothetical protein
LQGVEEGRARLKESGGITTQQSRDNTTDSVLGDY